MFLTLASIFAVCLLANLDETPAVHKEDVRMCSVAHCSSVTTHTAPWPILCWLQDYLPPKSLDYFHPKCLHYHLPKRHCCLPLVPCIHLLKQCLINVLIYLKLDFFFVLSFFYNLVSMQYILYSINAIQFNGKPMWAWWGPSQGS